MRLSSILFAMTILASPAVAADYYVAPLNAKLSCTGTGSKECPWPSIGAAFASKKIAGGDTILLMDGDHGSVQEKYWTFNTTVTIQSETDKNARISSISFGESAKNIRLRNLRVWRDEDDAGTSYLIRAYNGSSYLTFENLDVRSREDSINYLKWDKARWVAVATRAFDLRGSFNIVRNNKITGVKEGIIAGPDSLVENNRIDGIAGDGMKGVSRSIFRNNTVQNSFAVIDGYHRDGFQSYSGGDPIVGLVLDGNKIFQWNLKTASPLMGSLQGIGMFDGWYDDLVIRNNLVVTDHSHGISVYGTRGAKIVNNTVVNLSGQPGVVPYLKVTNKKSGEPSKNVLVANNVAMKIQVTPSTTLNIFVTKNSAVLYPATSFADVKTHNYSPTPASGFIDTGDVATAPVVDILGLPRPSGKGPDRGAYEVQAGRIMRLDQKGIVAPLDITDSVEGQSEEPITDPSRASRAGDSKWLKPPSE